MSANMFHIFFHVQFDPFMANPLTGGVNCTSLFSVKKKRLAISDNFFVDKGCSKFIVQI